MPITSLICPCSPEPQPLDHFESGACGGYEAGQDMPQAWAAAIVRDRTEDRYHADGRLTVTRLLTCPRETLINDFLEVPFDVWSANNMFWGTAMHEMMERASRENPQSVNQYIELRFGGPGDKLPPAVLFKNAFPGGVEICGKTDHITAGFVEIHDYKGHAEGGQRYAKGKVQAQLNLYRLSLLDVMPEARGKLDKLIAFHGAMVTARGPKAWIPEVLPIMTEEQILESRPGGADHTVREIIQIYRDFEERRKAGMGIEENLRQVPLVGRPMFGRKKCSNYCQPGVKGACDQLEGITTLV